MAKLKTKAKSKVVRRNREHSLSKEKKEQKKKAELKKLSKLKFKFAYEPARQHLLRALGVDYTCLMGKRNEFDVIDSLVKIKPKLEYYDVQLRTSISTKRQVNSIVKLLTNPLRGAPTICISSFPTDLRAKLIACQIMNVAIDQHQARTRKHGQTMPRWHKVYGGYKDELRDKDIQKERESDEYPCMLILTNVLPESTPYKLEKLRDLLEKYDDIPRIVVLGGSDPLTFFATKLQYPLNHGIMMGITKPSEIDQDEAVLEM